MTKAYTDKEFYAKEYLMGRTAVISDADFPFYVAMATKRIRHRTCGNIDENEVITEEVQMCCCEVAERLCKYESAKDEAGRVLQSFSNDGNSGTFADTGMSRMDVDKEIDVIIKRALSGTGLLYCGVKRK